MLIETLTFRLAPDVDQPAFLEADRRVQTEFIPNHQGFVRRTTARGADGEWLVVTLWGSAECADESAGLGDSDPVSAALMAMVADPVVKRYETLE